MLTIEGFAGAARVRARRGRLRRHAAVQCGFCTPGFLLTIKSLLDAGDLSDRGGDPPRPRRQPLPLHRLPRPSSKPPRHRGSGRLSIATETGTREVGPLAHAARRAREAARRGAVHRRPRGAGDAPRPRAAQPGGPRRDRLDRHLARAERMPGVAAVLVGADLLDIDPYYGHAIKDRPIVAIERVRFSGEPVAAVAAEDPATAEAALRAIEVDLRRAAARGHDRPRARAGRAAAPRGTDPARAVPRARQPRASATATSATATA